MAAGLNFPFLVPKDGSQAFYVSGGIRVDANKKTQVYEGTYPVTERWGFGTVLITLAPKEVTSAWRPHWLVLAQGSRRVVATGNRGAEAAGGWLASLPPHESPSLSMWSPCMG